MIILLICRILLRKIKANYFILYVA